MQNSKVLIAYFSASGVTEKVALTLAAVTNGDVFEIKPTLPYSERDLDWTDKNSRSTLEMNNNSCRPAITELPKDIENYDTLFLGFPIWWYIEPRIIDTFIENCDLSGKKVITFATSGSSGMGKTMQRLKRLCKDAEWKNGGMRNGNQTKATLSQWIKELEI